MRSSARTIIWSMLVVLVGVADGASQTPSVTGPSIVPAKFDEEGLSQFLVPVRLNDANFWCSLDSGGSWVLSIDRAKHSAQDFDRTEAARARVSELRLFGTSVWTA